MTNRDTDERNARTAPVRVADYDHRATIETTMRVMELDEAAAIRWLNLVFNRTTLYPNHRETHD